MNVVNIGKLFTVLSAQKTPHSTNNKIGAPVHNITLVSEESSLIWAFVSDKIFILFLLLTFFLWFIRKGLKHTLLFSFRLN